MIFELIFLFIINNNPQYHTNDNSCIFMPDWMYFKMFDFVKENKISFHDYWIAEQYLLQQGIMYNTRCCK